MSIGEEQTECPLCMEPLELDDINFFPCTCGYQICRFCWHRIRTDENGLCPACRKQYPEDPAQFKPLTEDELQRIKKERRQKDLQRKQKAAENRKHLANVRVVQKNLVFVVGLSQRLADTEVLKKQEYFGKFGKIHKVVINHSTSYAGAQGPSASAYVTYHKPEDALRAIQAVNNIFVDGRTLKASLGTTKYCSHFLRGAQCPKPDCMYLHELGEEIASFTKEEMQQGKHQEYEQKLHEQYMNSQNLANQAQTSTTSTTSSTRTQHTRKKSASPQTIQGGQPSPPLVTDGSPPVTTNKEAWPSLQGGPSQNKPERLTNGNKAPNPSPPLPSTSGPQKPETTQTIPNRAPGHHRTRQISTDEQLVEQHAQINGKSRGPAAAGVSPGSRVSASPPSYSTSPLPHPTQLSSTPPGGASSTQFPQMAPASGPSHSQLISNTPQQTAPTNTQNPIATRKSPFVDPLVDSMSLFSNSGFPTSRNPKQPLQQAQPAAEDISTTEIPDTMPVITTTDWQAAFGFTSSSMLNAATNSTDTHDDDLGFDPWDESAKGLADLLEKEIAVNPLRLHGPYQVPPPPHLAHQQPNTLHTVDNRPSKALPPGFNPNHIGAYNGSMPSGLGGANMVGLMQFPSAMQPSLQQHPPNTYRDVLSNLPIGAKDSSGRMPNTQNDAFNMKDWQDGLRALLPNINISFGVPPNPPLGNHSNPLNPLNSTIQPAATHKRWSSGESPTPLDQTWDPAIVTSGHVAIDTSLDEPPHWMDSLQHLTDDSNTNQRLPFFQQFPFRAPTWAPQAQHPPPGFHQAPLRQHTQHAETQLAEGLQ